MKEMHTQKYIHRRSIYSLVIKLGMLNGLIHRAQLCDLKKDLLDELNLLRDVLSQMAIIVNLYMLLIDLLTKPEMNPGVLNSKNHLWRSLKKRKKTMNTLRSCR